jgi:cell division septal protein FtsQ
VPELRLQGVEILKALPNEGRLSLKDTSEVRYDDQHGFLLTLQKPKLQVELGKEDLALKLDRARRVAEYIEQHGINASRIDADYGKKVLVKVQSSR